jgi:hypothetical protein
MITLDICVYCEEKKPVMEWKETGELVCRDCRHDFVDQQFNDGATLTLEQLQVAKLRDEYQT